MDKLEPLDPLIHSRIRLSILSVLLSVKEADFNHLKEITGATDGNLSTHLTKLEQAGYIRIEKIFVGKKPRTKCSLTSTGRDAFEKYIMTLEKYLHPK